MVGASGGSSAVRSARSGRSAVSSCTCAEIGAQLAAAASCASASTSARNSAGPSSTGGLKSAGASARARAELALGAAGVAEPLEHQAEVMVRPGVVRVLVEHLVEGALGVGEAAQIEQRHRALVARVQIVGRGGQRRVEPHERLARAAEIVERLPLEQRQPRRQRAIGRRRAGAAACA